MSGRSKAVAFLGLGGNLGDPQQAMASALHSLDSTPDIRVIAVSAVYRTPPWGKTDQPDFLNAVAKLETTLQPRELLARCLDAERALKRVRDERWGPRSIDLDILWFDGRAVSEPGLDIPHPRMLDRAFVLVPLAEIAPNLDLSGASAAEHAAKIDQQGIVAMTVDGDWWRKT